MMRYIIHYLFYIIFFMGYVNYMLNLKEITLFFEFIKFKYKHKGGYT